MKTPLSLLRLLVVLVILATAARAATPPDSPELVEARAKLLELFQRNMTDEDTPVKQQRAKITALEYIAAARAGGTADSPYKTVSVEFPGGTVAALVAAIEKAGGGLNLIAEADDLRVQMPPFTIRNADSGSLATALDGLLRTRGYILQGTPRTQSQAAAVYVLRKMQQYERTNANDSRFQSFQLGPYLEFQTVDDIVGAVHTMWALDPMRSPDALRVKFHPPTGILLVSGPSEGIQMVEIILRQLRRSSEQAPRPNPAAAPAEKK
jgi:hypothetical protein